METIPDVVDRLSGVRFADITQQRLIRLVLEMYDTTQELQDRIRILENTAVRIPDIVTAQNSNADNVIPLVKLKYGANTENNDTRSLDKTT